MTVTAPGDAPETAAVALVQRTYTFAGVRTRAVEVEGEARRPRLLFLHGFSDSASTWRRVQRRLGAAGYSSLAIDQPGHGCAGPLDCSQPVVPQFVAFARAAAEHLGEGRPVVVVGNSLGGAHALLLAERHPELVAGVVAISPAAFDHSRWMRLMDQPALRRGMQSERDMPAILRTLTGPGMRMVGFGRPWRAPQGFIDEWCRNIARPEQRAAMRHLGLRMNEEYLCGPFELDKVQAPVLALWGDRDRVTLISSRRAMEDGLRDLEFVPLRGLGHMPQLEAPGRTTKHLRRFLDRLEHA